MAARAPEPLLGRMKIGRAARDVPPRVEISRCADGDVVVVPLEDHRRRRRIGPAAPQARHPRVPRTRRIGAVRQHRRRQQQGVLIHPRHRTLGLRQVEPALRRRDEPTRGEVELAHLHRVRAAARQSDQRPVIRGATHHGARIHPVHALLAGQRVHVDERLPRRMIRRGGALLEHRPRHAAPQTPGVVPVLPDVVGEPAAQHRPRDPVRRVQDLQRPGVRGLGVIARREIRDGAVAALGDPGEGFRAVDLFQKQVRVRE